MNGEPIDRSQWPVRKLGLHDEEDELQTYAHFTPDERIAMVDELTRTAWSFYSGSSDEPAFRRDVVRLHRRAR